MYSVVLHNTLYLIRMIITSVYQIYLIQKSTQRNNVFCWKDLNSFVGFNYPVIFVVDMATLLRSGFL